ncbi:MAG TPA: BTAD domain-containing putative transcriptional regulator [Candidatus Limnocylindrales bacterium]
MNYGLLGPVRFWSAGRPFAAGQPRQSLVLAGLLADAGRLVTAEQLVDRVWGQDPPAGARRALHSHIARVRKALARAANSGQQPPALLHLSGGYVLEVDPDLVDAHRFRRLVGEAAEVGRGDRERMALLRQAVALWRGEPLAGLPGQWASMFRSGWHGQRVQAAVAWAWAAQRAGDIEAVIAPLTDLTTEYPLAESLVAALMRVLHSTGRGAEALEYYTITRARMVSELGTEPGAELQEVHRLVLRRGIDRPMGTADGVRTLVPHVVDIPGGLTVPLILPEDLTEPEAKRLTDFISSLVKLA